MCLAIVASPGRSHAAPRVTQGGDPLEIVLAPGEQKTISGEGVDAISVGAPGVADVRITDDQKQVLIVGVAPGSTTMLVLMRDGTKVQYKITVSRIRARRNIRLDFYFVQVSKTRGLELGILWPTSISATAVGQASVDQSGDVTAAASVVSQVLPRLDFARDRGWAKVMDQARVVVTNGEEATYSSGGEVNVRVATGFAAALQKISFGTLVNTRVSYDDVTGRLEGRVKAEVSRLTPASTDALPGRAVLALDTTFNLELGQSVALAGLFSDDETEAWRGIPLLSEIPILGVFFGGKSARTAHTENVIFIVPTLVDAIPLEQRDRVEEALRLYRSFEGKTFSPHLGDLARDRSPLLPPAPPPADQAPVRRGGRP
jgi:Flp pilus assembly secretin CpaC